MTRTSVDGNHAAADVAYRCSEAIGLYPITPASPMGELSDGWAAGDRPNLWGDVPRIVEMQSEAGAAGTLHGMVQGGALGTTFTASQGLLLMLPNMYKIAGELTPTVIHVAARSIATHALSIFGDHSDVMSARGTGFTMLASASPQEAHDMAAVAHAATMRSRVPFLHFFDGFRTSHEINGVELLDDLTLRSLFDPSDLSAHRGRALSPEHPVLRGSAQNPDVFFQAREAANPYHDAVADVVQATMDELRDATGRAYELATYHGAPDAERVIVLMGSGVGAAREAVDAMADEKVGVLQVRLFRPWPAEAVLAALPTTVRRIAVLDRTKEPGSVAEPLHQDVLTTYAQAAAAGTLAGEVPLVVGGRYGLSSKEFTPGMVKGVFDELAAERPRPRFTVGINDDVTHLSVAVDDDFVPPRTEGAVDAVFFGLGSDGTVGANKNTVKIVGEHTDLHAQGYFVYDSKKSGAVTVSHLRFSPQAIQSTYLIDQADFVACHQFGLLDRLEIVERARPGGTLLVNAPFGPDELWGVLPREVQEEIAAKDLAVHVIDAHTVARDVGLPGRINTVMQACFFALAGMLPQDEAMDAIRDAIRRTYAKRGPEVVERNLAAVDAALGAMHRVTVPAAEPAGHARPPVVPDHAPDFVQRVTATMLAGHGDRLPVSALPVDGTFPTGTAKYEKRGIAAEIPVWDPDLCIDCGKCAIVCPHAAIRIKAYDESELDGAPDSFLHKDFRDRTLPGRQLTVQVAPDDCTGCTLCVDVCPARSKEVVSHKAITMAPRPDHVEVEPERFDFFLDIAPLDRSLIDATDVKHSQLLEPMFEFSGACSGCGETPYLKLLTQLFGDRMVVANATGCSSIYGGNLPTTPWSTDADGRGPAWSNSLFEDNAEFGLGLRLAHEAQATAADRLLGRLRGEVDPDLIDAIRSADQSTDAGIAEQRQRVVDLRTALDGIDGPVAARLDELADRLVRHSHWIIGGDGWAYDIGYGGLDHVLASGMDVNILVMDTEVYSNTGGQASKATARGAVAKFAAAGKPTPKKDLGLLATQYGDVYVAQIAMGANQMHTVRALREAEAWPGPSLVLAYSTCIAHGIDMTKSMQQQDAAVKSGYWPLYRFHPEPEEHAHPFQLDSKRPTLPLVDFTREEGRYEVLRRSAPERAAQLATAAQADVDERWRYYEQLAGVERTLTDEHTDERFTTEDEA